MRPIVPKIKTPNGLILLRKEPGVTSFQALFPLKRVYGTALGHTGTLDQFAQGLLVVLTGKLTKLNALFSNFDKAYEADFTFGRETATGDPEGETTFQGPLPTWAAIEATQQHFCGELDQVPPVYSAIHVQGQRAYQRVLAGEVLDLPPRRITIYKLELVSWQSPVLKLRIHCSKGTYIRSIARDWGRLLGSGAYVSRLERYQVGPFELPEVEPVFLKDLEVLQALHVPMVVCTDVVAIRQGKDLSLLVPELDQVNQPRAGLVSDSGELVAIVEKLADRWKYQFVLPAEVS